MGKIYLDDAIKSFPQHGSSKKLPAGPADLVSVISPNSPPASAFTRSHCSCNKLSACPPQGLCTCSSSDRSSPPLALHTAGEGSFSYLRPQPMLTALLGEALLNPRQEEPHYGYMWSHNSIFGFVLFSALAQ